MMHQASHEALQTRLNKAFESNAAVSILDGKDMPTLEVDVAAYIDVVTQLQNDAAFSFEQLSDLCGVDYLQWGDGAWQGRRYAVVVHLLSVTHNVRLRVRVFALDEYTPIIPSVIELWPSANWAEREAFDLYGIMFTNHPDLRRILTDYGFIGHPFRKDFPLSGHVEMRYDPEKQGVVYEAVSIDARVVVPRVLRKSGYAEGSDD